MGDIWILGLVEAGSEAGDLGDKMGEWGVPIDASNKASQFVTIVRG